MKKILVVDDEKSIRESVRFSLQDKYRIFLASTGVEAIDLVTKEIPDLVILDILMPDRDGLDILKEIKEINKEIPVVMLTGISRVKTAVEAMKLGAFDYITKPYDIEELTILVANILKSKSLKEHISFLEEELDKEYPVNKIIFRSKKMKEVLDNVLKVAPTNSSILLLGPTGVGKELIARLIHSSSLRKENPFIPIHCAAVPEALFESELFGYEKGAFTNAFKRKTGKIEIAGSGTIFLDEVSEIPLSLQVKLLRYLQEKEFSRLGGNEVIKSEARILSASSKHLKEEVAKGSFREDFYYRLSVVPIEIPSLMDRKEDIIPLVMFYFDYFRKQIGCRAEKISERALEILENYDWPGNVRELKNIIERILVLKGNKVIIDEKDLPDELNKVPYENFSLSFKESVEQFEKGLILQALEKKQWNQSQSAKILNITRRILRYKMEKLKIKNG